MNKIFTIMLVVLFSGNVNSHSGRTNQDGCHVDDSFTLTVDYHCHEKKHSNNLNLGENWCITSISCGIQGCCGYSSYSSCKHAAKGNECVGK